MTPAQALAARARAASSDAGVPKARAIMSSALAGCAAPKFPLPVFPTPSQLERMSTPRVQPHVYSMLDNVYRRQLMSELDQFAAGLPDDASRATFRSGHRLTKKQRNDILNRLEPDQIAAKGLRFSDGPSPYRDDDHHARIRATPSLISVPQPPPDPGPLLADLWYFADPLLLELTVDTWKNGANLGYSGDFTTDTAPNMARTRDELRNVAAVITEEITAGRVRGFYPVPPFLRYKVIPAGLTPKKDGSLRPIDNFSAHGHASVNAQSDHVEIGYPGFAAGINNLRSAGNKGKLLSWDVEKAYANNPIRLQCQWLTVMRLPFDALDDDPAHQDRLTKQWRLLTGSTTGRPKFIYAYRTHCSFGLAASGFRWEACGGKPLIAYYAANQHRVVVLPRPGRIAMMPHTHFPLDNHGNDQLLADRHTEPAVLDAPDDSIIHPVGHQRLKVLHTRRHVLSRRYRNDVDLCSIARNVDDFFKGFDHSQVVGGQADRTMRALIFLHARIGLRLKSQKFTGLADAVTYNGFALMIPDTIAFPHDKCDRLRDKLRRVQHSVADFKALESAIGSCIYLTQMYPQLIGTMSPLYSAMYSVAPPDAPRTTKASRRRRHGHRIKVNMSNEALATIRLYLRVLRDGPASTSAAVRVVASPARARTILHTDWACKRDSDGAQGWGGVILTNGSWFSMPVPQAFVTAWGTSSPAMEAFAVLAALRAFAPNISNNVVLIFTDNIPFIQAFHRYHNNERSTSPGLTIALRAISFQLTLTSCVMFLEWVDTSSNLSDPLSRDRVQDFEDRIGSLRFSMQFSRVPDPSMPLPTF